MQETVRSWDSRAQSSSSESSQSFGYPIARHANSTCTTEPWGSVLRLRVVQKATEVAKSPIVRLVGALAEDCKRLGVAIRGLVIVPRISGSRDLPDLAREKS